MNATDWITIASVVVVALLGWLPFRYQQRKDAREHEEQNETRVRQAVKEAQEQANRDVDYLRTQLAQRERRIEELEDELRRRDDRP